MPVLGHFSRFEAGKSPFYFLQFASLAHFSSESPQKDSRLPFFLPANSFSARSELSASSPYYLMAQFTVQGRLKLPFNGDGVEAKDPFHYKLLGTFSGSRSMQVHKRKLRKHLGSASKLQSFCLGMSCRLNAKAYSDEGIPNDDDYDSEVEIDDLACFRGLVLDLAYRPVNVVCWKRALCLEFMEKADVLEYYDQTVNSPSGSFYIPAVLRVPHLLQVVKRRRIRNTLSRKNIFYRDSFICQYCSSHENLTIDHVVPVARGGEWKWENLVTACSECNSKKGWQTLEEANMQLIRVPKAPKDYDILAIPLTSAAIRMLRVRNGTPQEWRQYLAPSSDP